MNPFVTAADVHRALADAVSGPAVEVEEGTAVARVVLGAPAADGPWTHGDVVVDGETLVVAPVPGLPAVEAARRAGETAGGRLASDEVRVEPGDADADTVRAFVTGLLAARRATTPFALRIDGAHVDPARAAVTDAAAVRLALRLVSAPAAVVTPAVAADLAREIADAHGLTCTVWDELELRNRGCGGISAIGGGSVNPPRLVRLQRAAEPGSARLALVGKGITFDSGGLSLKSPAAMQSMRLDLGGAAAVLAVAAVLPRLDTAVGVDVVLPFAENLPGPGAVRPGDVVRTWNGTDVQILDTDFEGRVVLADALALAAADAPDLLIDLATLTYQAEIALGPQIAALLARDDVAADRVTSAAARAGEAVWRLPFARRYLDQVRVGGGVRNHPLHDSGRAITAALFLGEFVPETVPWAHLDMAGPAWRGDASTGGGTGFGAATLIRMLEATPRG